MHDVSRREALKWAVGTGMAAAGIRPSLGRATARLRRFVWR